MDNKSNLFRYAAGVITGISITVIVNKIYKKLKSISRNNSNELDIETQKKLIEDQNEAALTKEQLKRNFEFFGQEGMNIIKNSFVVVVGIGGVGR
jgi:hypothetical protein